MSEQPSPDLLILGCAGFATQLVGVGLGGDLGYAVGVLGVGCVLGSGIVHFLGLFAWWEGREQQQ